MCGGGSGGGDGGRGWDGRDCEVMVVVGDDVVVGDGGDNELVVGVVDDKQGVMYYDLTMPQRH